MDKYEDLIDVVSTIVRDYGSEILDGPKFWNVLSDSYSFASDYSLKKTYRVCLTEGYVGKIAALKGNRKNTIREVGNSVESLKKPLYKEDEVTAVLFSVAIAVGSCTKKDYEEFLNPVNRSQVSKSPVKQPVKPSGQRNHQWQGATNLRLLLGGLVSVVIGTLLYGLYLFHGWWMFFVLAVIGIIQCYYSIQILECVNQPRSVSDQSVTVSMGMAFAIAFFANSCISIFFQNYDFRRWAYDHWRDWQPTNFDDLADFGQSFGWNRIHDFPDYLMDGPGFLNIILAMVLLAMFITMIKVLIGEMGKYKFKIEDFLLSLLLIALVEGGIFAYAPIKQLRQEKEFLRKEKKIRDSREMEIKVGLLPKAY